MQARPRDRGQRGPPSQGGACVAGHVNTAQGPPPVSSVGLGEWFWSLPASAHGLSPVFSLGAHFCGAPLVHRCGHGRTPTLTLGLGQPLPHLRGQDPGASNCCGSPVAARTEQKTEPVGWTLLGFAGRLGQAMGSCGWRGWLEGPALRTGTPLARGSLPAHLAPCGFHSKGFSPLGSC